MFTSLKKWVKNEENSKPAASPPGGMQTMRSDLQRKFSKGVHYNLKIIIRGDRNTGKTCLWHRLQGHKFVEEYVPTPEIQAASIHWNYKATDDIVKVDVWDVVDQGKAKKTGEGLKISNEVEKDKEEQMLDASFLDVYKQAHAVIFVFDITKKWTYKYVEKELPKVPPHIPVLVLANFRDMGGHRVVELDELQYLVEGVERPPGSAGVMFLESSMKNGFGLKFIHKFFNLPFLLLQRESLLKQLETNYLDVESCLEELRFEPASEEQSFDCFMDLLEQRKQGKRPSLSPPSVSQSTPPGSKSTTKETTTRGSQRPTSVPIAQPVAQTAPNGPPKNVSEPPSPSPETLGNNVQNEQPKRGFMSRFFKGSTTPQEETKSPKINGTTPTSESPPIIPDGPVKNIDEFVPEQGSVDQFLNQIPEHKPVHSTANDDSSSSDSDDANPMVAGFQEDLDSDDDFTNDATHTVTQGAGKSYTYSDSDDGYIAQAQKQKRESAKTRTASKTTNNLRLSFGSDEGETPETSDAKSPNPFLDSDSELDTKADSPAPNPFLDPEPSTRNLTGNRSTSASSRDSNELNGTGERFERKKSKSQAKHDDDSDSSNDDNRDNHMVSKSVDDISGDDFAASDSEVTAPPEERSTPPPIVLEEEKEKDEEEAPSLQLQSSDFDFLESITSKPTKATGETPPAKTRKSKSASTPGSDDKKHKKKKKKKRSKTEDGDAKEKSATRKSGKKKKSKEEEDLEDFFGDGGESYEAL